MCGFIRNLLIVVGFLTVVTIGEMILDAHDEHTHSDAQIETIGH